MYLDTTAILQLHWLMIGKQQLERLYAEAEELSTQKREKNIHEKPSPFGQSQGGLLPPGLSQSYNFTAFGAEPMSWTFNITINSDAANLQWTLYSTWVPGDPSNP